MLYTIVHRNDELSIATSNYIKSKLENTKMHYDEEHPELIIVVGGDGTFYSVSISTLKNISNIIMVGIHTGTLGFLRTSNLMKSTILLNVF